MASTCRFFLLLALSQIAGAPTQTQAEPNTGAERAVTASVEVPAFTHIQLAGRPPGSVIGGASAPIHSPVQVGMTLAAGLGLRITATGLVSTRVPIPNTSPDGDPQNAHVFLGTYGTGGIAGLRARKGALVGIFLGARINDNSLPSSLNFRGGATDLPVLRPSVQQPFLIGRGETEIAGLARTFVVPAGATRLYLAVADDDVGDNNGAFTVEVSVVAVPTLPANPIQVHGITYLQLAGRTSGSTLTIHDYSVPTNSPAEVGLNFQPGQQLRITAFGAVQTSSGATWVDPKGSPGSSEFLGTYQTGGIGGIRAPRGSLIGVFLGNSVNDQVTPPPSIDFGSAGVQNASPMSPLLQQLFYIGDGRTTAGALKHFVVPSGATRLFLAVADGEVDDNRGWFFATVSPDTPTTPLFSQNSLVNGADFGPAPVSAGSIVSIFGDWLSSSTAAATGVPLPRLLADTVVWFNLTQAPLFFVSPGQVNVQVPWQFASVESVQVTISRGNVPGVPVFLQMSPPRPGIFDVPEVGPIIVSLTTGQLVKTGQPTRPGDVLLIYATGLGPVSGSVQTGAAASLTDLSACVVPVQVVLDGAAREVMFAGLAPGFVGVYQINFRVPEVAAGEHRLQVSLAGVLSNEVIVNVAP